jgi:hypothetical protein
MTFTLLTGAFFPQVSGEIGNRADLQNGRLEMMSFISTQLHGVPQDGDSVSADRAISYAICGAENLDSTPVFASAGEPELLYFWDEDINYINGNPGGCEEDEDDNKWNFEESDSYAENVAREDSYSTLLPVRGGGIAEIEVEYGVG